MSDGQALRRLAALLADGRFHSGHALAATLGVGRSTVWNHVRALEAAGLEIFKVRGRGYRLADPLELLDARRIAAAMSPARRGRLRGLEVLFTVDSTNRHLADAARAGARGPIACLAEAQTAGRGRRGRDWASPLARNLYCSLLWRLVDPPRGPGGLSLAVGVAVAEVLESTGLEGLRLKWPNDLVVGDAKLGGILVELAGESGGPWDVVVGVGINVAMPSGPAAPIAQPWTDLAHAMRRPPGRNALAGALLDRLIGHLDAYERGGFAAFREAWSARDAVRDRPVTLHEPAGVAHGTARGVDEQGALIFEADGARRAVVAGEVSLRAEAAA